MILPEITRIREVKCLGNEFSTYDANEFFPELTAREMGSILKADERAINIGKRWLRVNCGYANISIWRFVK